jgi:CheY-like chemotaxis protein
MIYLVDDDPIQNLLTSQLIQNSGIEKEYQIFNNGQEVVEELDKGGKPTIILLDINMPIMDGWEFLELYSKKEKQADVYMLTSSSNGDDLAKADEFECIKGYFTKPINADTIKSIFKL